MLIKRISALQRQSGNSDEPAANTRSNFDMTAPVPGHFRSIAPDRQVNLIGRAALIRHQMTVSSNHSMGPHCAGKIVEVLWRESRTKQIWPKRAKRLVQFRQSKIGI